MRPTGVGGQRLGEGGSATSLVFKRFLVSASEGREAVHTALVICVPSQPQVPESCVIVALSWINSLCETLFSALLFRLKFSISPLSGHLLMAVIASTEVLNMLAEDLRFLFDQRQVDTEVQICFADIGLTTISLFALLADDVTCSSRSAVQLGPHS